MYIFRPCSYDKLQQLIATHYFALQAWKLVDEAYIDGLEIVEDSNGVIIALIYYDAHRNEICEMFIQEFEVCPQYRRHGHGKKIIYQFLTEHPTSVELLPLGDDSVSFWKACGFEGDSFGMYYYPEE